MKQKQTQAQRILRHLEAGRKLTPIDALNRYGCMRLAARISDLKKEGWDIQKKMIDKNGKQYAQYWLCSCS